MLPCLSSCLAFTFPGCSSYLGAQVTYAFQNRQAYVQERKAETVSQRGREFVAVRLMAHLAGRFTTGARPPTASEMAEELRIPLRLVGQIMGVLMQAGLVLEVAGAESGYAPARPLESITLRDLFLAMRGGQDQELVSCDDPARPIVCQEFEAIESVWQGAAAGLTLEALVQRITKSSPVLPVHA